MNLIPLRKISMAFAAAAALGTTALQAQTTLTTSYTNSFSLGDNTASFSGSGSVASWIYWYNTPGGNSAMTCVYGLSADGDTATSGCLEVDSPFTNTATQNVFFGTFDNGWGYDFNEEANLVNYSNITFKIKVAPGIALASDGTFGTIGVGIVNSSYGYEEMGRPTIPAAASNSWVTLTVPIVYTLANLTTVPGLAFDIESYGGYPLFPFTNYLDDIELHLSPVKVAPPTIAGLQKPTDGLNIIATAPGSSAAYDRYQLATVNDTGYSFVDNSSVTYSWKILSFPQNTEGNFQQHFFIVNGEPGQYDQAADWNLTNCIFITVQEQDDGVATMSFRYKTNEPAGNGMFFNTTSPTNTTNNVHGWPIQPVCSLITSNGAVGTWSVTFAATTGVTLTAPDGTQTNFVLDAASAALFADPASLILGGQPNNVNGDGLSVVYGSFSATGCSSAFTDDFSTDTELNTNYWKNLSSDTNGAVLVPPGSAYWLSWSIPDSGFSLQDAPSLTGGATYWTDLVPLTIQDNGHRVALLSKSLLPAGGDAFFRLIERQATQLQVLLPGETNAPNTASGKVGTPETFAANAEVDVTINLVDSTFHLISSTDSVQPTTTDTSATLVVGNNGTVNLSGGSAVVPIYFGTDGSWTVSASDVTETNIVTGISSTITIQN